MDLGEIVTKMHEERESGGDWVKYREAMLARLNVGTMRDYDETAAETYVGTKIPKAVNTAVSAGKLADGVSQVRTGKPLYEVIWENITEPISKFEAKLTKDIYDLYGIPY
jgi:hypothetical protein